MSADKVQGATVVQEVAFPSDTLLEILNRTQVRNGCATWKESQDKKVLRQHICDAVYCVIRMTIRSVEQNPEFGRDIDLSRNGAFYTTFAIELLRAVIFIVGPLRDEEDDVLSAIYTELIAVCLTRRFRGEVSHEFTYMGSSTGGKFVIAPAV